MELALFDLDNTLLKGDSDDLWSRYLMHIGILDERTHKAKSDAFYQSYLNGTLDITSWLEYQLEPLTQHPVEELLSWRMDFISEWIVPLVLPLGLQRIDFHRQKGADIMIVTATNEFITQPIADYLNVPYLIACQVEKNNQGAYTGRSHGTPSFKEGKITRLHEWLKRQGKQLKDYEESWFYSDSHNDIPLLSLVNHAVAVNPDDKLLHHAQEKNWKIMDFRLQ